MNERKILCENPCRDSGLYDVCYSELTRHCNILNGRAVSFSDGTPVKEDPRTWGDEDMGLSERLNTGL